ncbi:MAG: 6-bladed beta-propeller [Acidobacteriota bacterium]|nr:6-bladed beta-propeller [Acidobacteriota bacterium]
MKVSPGRLTGTLLLLAFAAGCATTAPPSKLVKPVWPDPPQKARIQFVTGLRSKEDLPQKKSFGSKFQDAAFGSSDIANVYQPSGLAISDDDKRLYVADWVRGYLVVFDFEQNATRVIGGPDSGQPLSSPFSVALDASENVYAVEKEDKVVRVYDRSGKFLRNITTLGTEPFERPTGLAIDKKRDLLYIADSSHVSSLNHRIFVFTTGGKFVRFIGTRGNIDGAFNVPTFLHVDDDGKLYVSDSLNFRIQIFDADGKFLAKFGQQGDAPGYFSKIKGVAKDTFGNVYVVDAGMSGVTLFNSKFEALLIFGGYSAKPGYFQGPTAIAIDKSNRIYVADNLSARINVYQLLQTKPEESFEESEGPKK